MIKPFFSIIIPTYRRTRDLCQCLEILDSYFDVPSAQPLPFSLEVIVSDDARDQDLRLLLCRRYPWCLYTEGPASGPAANRNHAADLARGVWLVFTDDDCLPQPGWIEAFAQHVDHYVVLEGRTIPSDRRIRLDQECPVNEFGGYLWSCNFAIRRDHFFRIGRFNESFPVSAMEDVDLNYRVNKAGLSRRFLSNAEVRHPWRPRKGFTFMRLKAHSTATYVSLHPETAPFFSFASQIRKVLRMLRSTTLAAFTLGTSKGFIYQISLDMYYFLLTWLAVIRYCK